MANLSNTTRDHDEIRRWAEERAGKPAHVKNTGSAEDIGILRIDFPGYSGEGSLEPISWEDFFKKFDERGLALVYQEETAGGQKSNFNKLVSADSVEEGAAGARRQGRSRGSRSGGFKRSGSATTSAAKKGGASKKRAASASTRFGGKAAPKKASGKKAASKGTSSRKAGAKKSSSKGAARKKSSAKKGAKKQSARGSAAKRSAARRRK